MGGSEHSKKLKAVRKREEWGRGEILGDYTYKLIREKKR